MIDGLKLLLRFMVSRFRSERRLEAEIVVLRVLRHQLNVLRRKMPSRPRLTLLDRLIFVWLYRCRPAVLNAVTSGPKRSYDGTATDSVCIGAGSLAHAAAEHESQASYAVSFVR
jgi:hypothetical protein